MTEIEKLENDLILIHNTIEPKTKLGKLKEERREFNRDYRNYMKDPTKNNFDLMILELFDILIVVLQLAIVKHGYNLAEIKATAINKLKLTVSVGMLMKKDCIGYNEARGRLR